MEEVKILKNELQGLDDMVEEIGQKIHRTADLLGLSYMGLMKIGCQDNSYEMSTISIIEDYLRALEKEEIATLHEKLEELKQSSQT